MARTRYDSVAMSLHWLIAIAIIGLFIAGKIMTGMESGADKFAFYQLHKSLGLSVLVLSLARLLWRVLNPPPPLPAAMPAWQRAAAHAVHWALYGLIIAIPLAGWLMVSVSPRAIPTLWFGLFEVPHLPVYDLAADPQAAESAMKAAHEWLATGAIALAVLHAAAALKHQFIDRDRLLARMIPGLRAAD